MSEFKSVRPEAISGNFIEAIGQKWALLTATKPDGSFKLIRRAEKPSDYFATFDCTEFTFGE